MPGQQWASSRRHREISADPANPFSPDFQKLQSTNNLRPKNIKEEALQGIDDFVDRIYVLNYYYSLMPGLLLQNL